MCNIATPQGSTYIALQKDMVSFQQYNMHSLLYHLYHGNGYDPVICYQEHEIVRFVTVLQLPVPNTNL